MRRGGGGGRFFFRSTTSLSFLERERDSGVPREEVKIRRCGSLEQFSRFSRRKYGKRGVSYLGIEQQEEHLRQTSENWEFGYFLLSCLSS